MKLLRYLFLALVGVVAVVLLPQSVLAAVPPGMDVPVGVDSQADSLLNLDPFVVEVLIGIAIPFLVAFVTNEVTKPGFKKLLLGGLSAIGGMVTTAAAANDAGNAIISVASLKAAFLVFAYAGIGYGVGMRNSKTEDFLQKNGPDIGPKVAA